MTKHPATEGVSKLAVFSHYIQDFPVGFPHSQACHTAHGNNGVIHAFFNNAFPIQELIFPFKYIS